MCGREDLRQIRTWDHGASSAPVPATARLSPGHSAAPHGLLSLTWQGAGGWVQRWHRAAWCTSVLSPRAPTPRTFLPVEMEGGGWMRPELPVPAAASPGGWLREGGWAVLLGHPASPHFSRYFAPQLPRSLERTEKAGERPLRDTCPPGMGTQQTPPRLPTFPSLRPGPGAPGSPRSSELCCSGEAAAKKRLR